MKYLLIAMLFLSGCHGCNDNPNPFAPSANTCVEDSDDYADCMTEGLSGGRATMGEAGSYGGSTETGYNLPTNEKL